MAKMPRHHPNVDDAALERAVRDLVPLMSDAKWVRLLDALTRGPDVVMHCDVKLVWREDTRVFFIANATYEVDYYRDSVEGLIAGPSMGWHRYKEIEWIEFPPLAEFPVNESNRKAGTRLLEQDLSAIRSRIEGVGTFDLRNEPTGLRLYAYLRGSDS
jgi:hypothetical protein